MSRRKKEAILHIVIFFACLVIPTLLWGILSAAGVSEKLNVDTGENRNLFTFDEDLSVGNLTVELENYYNDRVPFRSILLKINNGLETAVEFPYSKGIEPVLIALANAGTKKTEEPQTAAPVQPESSQSSATETAAATPEPTPAVDDSFFPFKDLGNGVIQGREDWLFYADTLNDYSGSSILDDYALEYFTGVMQSMDDICTSQGIDLKFICFPNKNTIYGEYMPTYEKTDRHRAQVLEEYVHANTDLEFDFVYEELLEQKSEHPMYYHQDTHWTSWGVITGVNALYDMIGVPRIELSSLQIEDFPGTTPGDLAQMANLSDPTLETYTTMTYKPELKSTAIWNDVIDETHERCVCTSAAEDQRSLVIIGDSFIGNNSAGNFMEYLPQDFAHITYINSGKVTMDDAEVIRNADILVVEFVERHFDRVYGEALATVVDILTS